MFEAPGGRKNDPWTTWVWFVAVASAQLKVHNWPGARGSRWLHSNCAPPRRAAPPQLTTVLATAGPATIGPRAPNSVASLAKRRVLPITYRFSRGACRTGDTLAPSPVLGQTRLHNRYFCTCERK